MSNSFTLTQRALEDTDLIDGYLRSDAAAFDFDQRFDLRRHFTIPHDPIFAFWPKGTQEDFARFWRRQVRPILDPRTGILEVEVRAFSAERAFTLAQAIAQKAQDMSVFFAREANEATLNASVAQSARALEVLTAAEIALEDFRSETKVLDMAAETATEQTILDTLTRAIATLDENIARAPERDSRNLRDQRQILQTELDDRRARQSLTPHLRTYLSLERAVETAAQSYALAQEALNLATFETERQSRTLTLFIPPVLAQTTLHPNRGLFLALAVVFYTLVWAILLLGYASFQERR